jgi:hypothetical protein
LLAEAVVVKETMAEQAVAVLVVTGQVIIVRLRVVVVVLSLPWTELHLGFIRLR